MPLMRTTTLTIKAPIDPQPLDARFKPVRYDVPDRFRYIAKNNNKAFERLQIEVRSQLWQPYRFYTHDQLGPSNHALYVLYKGDDPVRSIGLNLLSVAELPQRTVSFEDLPHHMIIKLLQAQYFGEEESVRFTSQGKHFILARSGDERFIGLEIELTGAKTNNEREDSQIYRFVGHATRFIRVNPKKLSNSQLYMYEYVQRLSPKDGQLLLSVIPPDKVRDCPNPLFRIYREPSSRPTLDYHAQRNYKQTRGYLLYSFISAFINYLAEFGIEATQEFRDFRQYRVDKRRAQFVAPAAITICLLDQRLNQEDVPFAAYHKLLNQKFPQFTFKPIADIFIANQRPTLILQDATANAFEEGSIFAGESDPYQRLYRSGETAGWPKQSICVNPNDVETASSREAYLSYPLCSLSKPNEFLIRFQVSLNQLLLKDLVLNGTVVTGRLPFMASDDVGAVASLQSYVFVRRQTYKGISYPVLLFFEDGQARFLDLTSPDDKERRDTLLASLGLDWSRDVIGPWRAKYRIEKAENESKTPYHFILGPNQVVEVEDCREHVLYEYDIISARQEAIEEPLPLPNLKLTKHYDALKTQHMVPLAKLPISDELVTVKQERSDRISASLEFYKQLLRFDSFLDELAAHHRRISFNALTSGENAERLEAIFPAKESPDRAAQEDSDELSRIRSRLKRLYQRCGMFLSDKAKDVQSYKGIWIDTNNRFMVGSPEPIKFNQPRAHLIRRFDAYQGREQFPVELFFNTLGVLFVRPEQYTVYPYPFHLIDQYVETKLHWHAYAAASNEAKT